MEPDLIINDLKYKKNTKFYDLARVPKKVGPLMRFLEKIIIHFLRFGQSRSITKINMETLGPRDVFLTLCNHTTLMDLVVGIDIMFPRTIHYLMSIEGLSVFPYKLFEAGGVFCKRRFNSDVSIVRVFKKLVSSNQLVGLFPEARFSVTGELSSIPTSTGKICKYLGIPVVVMLFHGHYLVEPNWGNGKRRKLPIHCEQKLILTKEQVETMSVQQINEVIKKELYYNEWDYQKQNNILIKEDFRAEGLEKILYKCPHCASEFVMSTHRTHLKCNNCGAEYLYHEDSHLECLNFPTIFTSISDWLHWERKKVREEIEAGTYYYHEVLQTYAYPHPMNILDLGLVEVTHDLNGFKAKGRYNGADFVFFKKPQQNFSLQTEFSCRSFNRQDIFAFSTNNNTLFFIPHNPMVIQKLYFATEELYNIKCEK
ncbi:MAG: 1-acyl-sn-glycerol-3-phosphate acyltransferase [Acholeplasmatales bacterium]|jgi:1-acyl-sn-glycerol-3-phosphate acyltransferase/DNA-directed RNA polymerase subunit RPC12/RpoP|nr:1-acyl-sn-glycerol-3-phosphate acyltransferase [Acholeplasmatales bacterium]